MQSPIYRSGSMLVEVWKMEEGGGRGARGARPTQGVIRGAEKKSIVVKVNEVLIYWCLV